MPGPLSKTLENNDSEHEIELLEFQLFIDLTPALSTANNTESLRHWCPPFKHSKLHK